MQIKLNLSNILELIAIAVSALCGKIDLDSKKDCKIISGCLTAFSILYLLLGCLTLENDFIMMVLGFLQKNWGGLCIYLLLFALVPPAMASRERKNKRARIEPSYVFWNRIFNLFGACSACAMFGIAHDIIGDFSYLIEFHVEGIVSILISVCTWLVLAYQSIEQHKNLPDHDPDTKWLNQKLNMLHLFHAFFFSVISVVFIVCYSIYCHIHNRQLVIRPTYYILLTLALVFFYSLSQHFHEHVYMVFVVMVPVILVSSVYWMSWFSMSKTMRCLQWIFIVLHSLLYSFLIFYRKKMVVIRKYSKKADNRYGMRYKLGKWEVAIEHGFQMILLLIVIVCYSVSWLVPMLTQRIPASAAENFITKICENTDMNAPDMIELVKEQGAYDAVNQDYDSGKYLEFVFDELHSQLLEKGIVQEESTFLTYEELQEWYTTIP